MNKSKKPDVAYRGADLWLPKSVINEGTVKGSLTFQPKDKRRIEAFEETQNHLVVPRHYIPVEDLDSLGCEVVFEPTPEFFPIPDWIKPTYSLRRGPKYGEGKTNQVAMWKALVEGGDGVGVLKCGGGKTVIGIHAAMAVGHATMFIAHNGSLLGQWRDQILKHTNVEPEHIGVIGDGTFDWEGKPFCIASIHTLWQATEAGKLPEELRWHFGTMVYDEVHHMAAEKFNMAANLCLGVRWGLTATPDRTDGLDVLYAAHIGPQLYRDLEQDLTPDVFFIKTGMAMSTEQQAASKDRRGEFNVGKFYRALTCDDRRNNLLAFWVNQALEDGHEVMVLTPSRDHLDQLATMWDGEGVGVVHADVKVEDRAAIVENSKLLLSINELGIEGLDKASLSVVVLACTLKNRNNLQQIVGRIQRLVEGKPKPLVLVMFDEKVKRCTKWAARMQASFTNWNIPFRIIEG